MEPSHQNHLRHRRDIDGLRAIAILGVLIFHINNSLIPGGFLGVDVFFVISGFLITSIIQRGLVAGNFSITQFYERRIRRIIPALFVMILVVSASVVKLLPTQELEDYALSVKATVITTANIFFLDFLQDYFRGDSSTTPLMHTWSLAVEEQFYFVFPLLLTLLYRWRKTKRALIIAVALLLGVSLGACLIRGSNASMETFYLLPYRAWEILAGALLTLSGMRAPSKKIGLATGGVGALLVLGSFWAVTEHNLIPGISAIPACLGTVLLLYSGKAPGIFTARLLSWKPLVGLGLISYSVYLWHWPLIVFANLLDLPRPETSLPLAGAIFLLSLALGGLSWRFIEQPFRKTGTLPRKWVFLTWAGCTAVILLMCVWCKRERGFPGRYSERGQHILSFKTIKPSFAVFEEQNYDPQRAPLFGLSSAVPGIALWGDSHAAALLPAFDELAKQNQVSFRYFGVQGQVPITGVANLTNRAKDRSAFTEKAFRQILEDKQLTTVVLHGRWSLVNKGGNDGDHPPVTELYKHKFSSSAELEAYYAEKIRETVRRLLEADKRVVVIYPVPEVGINIPDLLAKQDYQGVPLSTFISDSNFFTRQAFILGVFESLPPDPNLLRIKLHEKFLSGASLKVFENGDPLYRDDGHLSRAGAKFVEDLLLPIFQDTGK